LCFVTVHGYIIPHVLAISLICESIKI